MRPHLRIEDELDDLTDTISHLHIPVDYRGEFECRYPPPAEVYDTLLGLRAGPPGPVLLLSHGSASVRGAVQLDGGLGSLSDSALAGMTCV